MMQNLCLSVTLLDGRFHGRGDGRGPEWPPSPWRLFQALLAGAHTGGHHPEWTDSHAKAFQWLEQRDPPLIVSPDRRELSGYTLSVPNNDMDRLAAAWASRREPRTTAAELRTLKAVRPSASAPDQPMTLHYLYPLTNDEVPNPEAETLCQAARCLHTFGWGIDAAVAYGRVLSPEETERLPGVRWRPHRGPWLGQNVRRVPKEGSLDDLTTCHGEFTRRVDGDTLRQPKRPTVFDRVAYLRDSEVPSRPFAAFLLRATQHPENWRPFRQHDANIVAAMLRSLTCRVAQADSHEFPHGSDSYVAGHRENGQDERPRFSYLVLPSIGHPHADGMIRRVLIAEPHGGDGNHAAWAANRLRGQTLTDKEGRPVAIVQASEPLEKVIRSYVAESRTWTSVTPVILPGYDDFRALKPNQAGSATKAERLLFKAIAQAGIPVQALSDVTLRKAPLWPGSFHPRDYQRPDYLRNLPGWHVSLKFREPVTGPLAIGAGRHCGLGVLAAEIENGS